MNLSAFNTKKFAEEGQFMQLEHPTEGHLLFDAKDKPIGITLKGKDSATYRKLAADIMRKLKAKGKKKEAAFSLDDIEFENAEMLAALTVGFTGIIDVIEDKEVKLQVSYEAALSLYVKYPVIFEQVQRFIDDRANFIKS